MKCLQLHSRILFVSVVLAGSLPADNLMNLKLTAEHRGDAIFGKDVKHRCTFSYEYTNTC